MSPILWATVGSLVGDAFDPDPLFSLFHPLSIQVESLMLEVSAASRFCVAALSVTYTCDGHAGCSPERRLLYCRWYAAGELGMRIHTLPSDPFAE